MHIVLGGLLEALANKEVMEVQDGQNTLFFFPRRKVGLKESSTNTRRASSQQALEEDSFSGVKELMENIAWKIEVSKKELAMTHMSMFPSITSKAHQRHHMQGRCCC